MTPEERALLHALAGSMVMLFTGEASRMLGKKNAAVEHGGPNHIIAATEAMMRVAELQSRELVLAMKRAGADTQAPEAGLELFRELREYHELTESLKARMAGEAGN